MDGITGIYHSNNTIEVPSENCGVISRQRCKMSIEPCGPTNTIASEESNVITSLASFHVDCQDGGGDPRNNQKRRETGESTYQEGMPMSCFPDMSCDWEMALQS
jgi:hypothetical protein